MAKESLRFFAENRGDQTFARKQAYVCNYVLVASTHKAVTIPTNAKYAIFNFDAPVWVCVGGTAAVPAADVTDGTGSVLNPVALVVEDETTIGLESEYAAKGSIEFYYDYNKGE